MLARLEHRGPDAVGQFATSGLVLGHRRLKILDLSDAANQPFTDGKDALIFNGEIFNHHQLRRQLASRYGFHTRSDTEVLFRGLQDEGERFLDKLEGQFALAYYDHERQTLLLGRDHVGICPLYLRENQDFLWFASEIKPLLAIEQARLDPSGVADYFRFRYNIQNGRTLFEGIRRFDPARYLLVDLKSGRRTERVYWRLRFTNDVRDQEDAQRDFNILLDQEIAAQQVADVPVGLFLSGGIDSGALLAGFAKRTASINAFTLRFSTDDDDGKRVKELAERHRFAQNILPFEAQDLDSLEEALLALEEPFGDLIISANYLLARHAARQVRVVLSGEGGDEAFCGYDHQRAFVKMLGLGASRPRRLLLSAFLAATPARALALASSYPGGFGGDERARIRRVVSRLCRPSSAYLSLVSLFDTPELDELFTPGFRAKVSHEDSELPFHEIFAGEEPWRAVMRCEIEQLTLIVNLLKQDRLTMHFSLEGRVPLLSRKVLEFAASLPRGALYSGTNKQFLLRYHGARTLKKKPFSLFSYPSFAREMERRMDATRESVESIGVLSWPAVETLRRRLRAGGMLATKQCMAVVVFHAFLKVFAPYLKE